MTLPNASPTAPRDDAAPVPEATAPKIFIIERGYGQFGHTGGALAEDGTPLGGHLSSSRSFLRHDMGVTSDWHHERYSAHYPNGFALVDLIDDSHRLADFPDYMAALERNRARATEPSYAPAADAAGRAG